MTGRPVEDFILDEDRPVLAATIASQGRSVMLRMLKKDGSTVWMENRATLVCDSTTGEAKEWVVTMRDITERKVLEQELSALALTDGLTGLPNRRAFDEALKREWDSRCERALRFLCCSSISIISKSSMTSTDTR
jgi:PleD family two-component response regulator